MNQPLQRRTEIKIRRLDLHRQEIAAKTVPLVSFILTHVALVLFLAVAFFIDRLVPNSGQSLVIKLTLTVVAVLFIASEFFYAWLNSRRWKQNIMIIYQLEEEQRFAEEQERVRQQENAIAIEQLRNRALQQRLRERDDMSVRPSNPHSSIRPTRMRPIPAEDGKYPNAERPFTQWRHQSANRKQSAETWPPGNFSAR